MLNSPQMKWDCMRECQYQWCKLWSLLSWSGCQTINIHIYIFYRCTINWTHRLVWQCPATLRCMFQFSFILVCVAQDDPPHPHLIAFLTWFDLQMFIAPRVPSKEERDWFFFFFFFFLKGPWGNPHGKFIVAHRYTLWQIYKLNVLSAHTK